MMRKVSDISFEYEIKVLCIPFAYMHPKRIQVIFKYTVTKQKIYRLASSMHKLIVHQQEYNQEFLDLEFNKRILFIMREITTNATIASFINIYLHKGVTQNNRFFKRRNSCRFTGRSRAGLTKFNLSRMKTRTFIHSGYFSGVTKSS